LRREVGNVLAIDLDVDADKALVHQARDIGVLERFMRHDVTPVSRGVAHRRVLRGPGETQLLPMDTNQQGYLRAA
jgi:hypothetical protein